MNKQSEYTKKWLEKSEENKDSKKLSDAKSRANFEQLKEHKTIVDTRYSELKKIKKENKKEEKNGK